MSFGIDDGPGIVIDSLVCMTFKDESNLFTPNGLYIQTKPREYAEKIPISVISSLNQLNVGRLRLTNMRPIFKAWYSFRPNRYDN